jgi:heme-degrading monooxygenase HmoA
MLTRGRKHRLLSTTFGLFLKGPEAEDHTLYASHTVWKNRATFEAWTKSEAFRAAHARAGDNKPLYLGHPQFEGFETIQTVGSGKAAVA